MRRKVIKLIGGVAGEESRSGLLSSAILGVPKRVKRGDRERTRQWAGACRNMNK